MSFYLALKEIWRLRGRYLLFSMVIALITILVLFIAALAGGLANANKQLIEKLDGEMLIYQNNVDLQLTASRLGQSKLSDIRRIDGVADVGPVGLATATVVFADGRSPIDIALVGVEPGKPGDPPLMAGPGLRTKRNNDAVIDEDLASRAGLTIGDRFIIKSVQGTEEEFYELSVVGITDSRQYFFLPSAIMPIRTWSKVRPQGDGESSTSEIIFNLAAVKLQDPQQFDLVAQKLEYFVDGIEVADKQAAILALPGYTAQQSTLNTQQIFTLLIGVLVVGGFFQIQTLQKVAQIGVLKAIGSSSATVAFATLLQIILVTLIGVGIGSLGTMLLVLGMPSEIPILFTGSTVISAAVLLLFIGPIGGLVSIRLALKIDPLTAIGLS
ncbi:MAG TPA: ABC transporter permease [Anaerolineales bacterium]